MDEHGFMNRVLVAYDGSEGAREAMADLRNAGFSGATEALVLAVADVYLPPAEAAGQPADNGVPRSIVEARRKAHDHLNEKLSAAKEGAAALGLMFPAWKIEAGVVADSPAWGVIMKAKEWGADWVVMGSHGRSLLHRLFLGSVAQKVATEAHCSARIFRRRQASAASDPLKILLCVDGSSSSGKALQSVATREWPQGTEVRVVTVVDTKLQSALAWPEFLGRRWADVGPGEIGERVAQVNQHAGEVLRAPGRVSVETALLHGDPKEALLGAIEEWKPHMICIGARGLNHGDRLFLGTTASALAARAACAVEIIR